MEEQVRELKELMEVSMKDNVNPNHYKRGGLECIDVIGAVLANPSYNAMDGFNIGNAIKYLYRAGIKEQRDEGQSLNDKMVEDLQKAVWYINKVIELHK